MKESGVPIISRENGEYVINGKKVTKKEFHQLFVDIKKKEDVRLKAKKST